VRELSSVENLERGYAGTEHTIEKMHKLVAAGKLDPTLQKIATWIRLSVPGDRRGNSRATAEAIFWWAKKHGIFQPDPFQIERIEHPLESTRAVIEARKAGAYKGPGIFKGDCDTFSIWVNTLGGILGFQYAFETAKVDAGRPDEFSHVWSALLVDHQWLALDASTPSATPGWRPPVSGDRFKRWPEKPIEDIVDMRGLNGHGLGDRWSEDPLDYDWKTQVDSDYYGYGIPSDYGGAGQVPETDAGREVPMTPQQPAVPRGELEPGLTWRTQKVDPVKPQERPMQMQPDTFWPRPHYEPAKPYYHTREPYPPFYPFSRQVDVEFKNVEAVLQRPPTRTVVDEAEELVGAGYEGYIPGQPWNRGMGDEPAGTAVTAPATATAPAAKEAAASSVWSTITGVINTVGAAIGASASKVASVTDLFKKRTTAAVAAVPGGLPPGGPAGEGLSLSSPIVLALGVLVIGGVAYALTSGGGGRGRGRMRVRHRRR
jgi:hypothetical protein